MGKENPAAEALTRMVGLKCSWGNVEARNDSLYVELRPEEYPGVGVTVQPSALRVDGELWGHATQYEGVEGATLLEEGQEIPIPGATVTDVTFDEEGIEPTTVRMKLLTE